MLNPLTTNHEYSHHRNPAACYQLVQSVLQMGSALAERVGQEEVGGCIALANSVWQLLQLAIEICQAMVLFWDTRQPKSDEKSGLDLLDRWLWPCM